MCSLTAAAFASDDVISINLHKAYFIEGPENFQPSGLTIFNNCLYTVSDKHDRFIYRLELTEDTAVAVPEIEIPLPLFSYLQSHDFEGITHDIEGNFYLASEALCRILRVSTGGKAADWITPDLKPAGEKAGLFQVSNGYLEGICRISANAFILCAERQPRGFIEIDSGSNPVQINAYQSETSKFEFPQEISKDFSGLCRYKNHTYVLERNAFIVCRLDRADNRLVESVGWSYRHAETSPLYRYADMEFGKAEGLYIDDNYIYIIFDNNGDRSAKNPDDRRPLLMLFDHPDAF